VRLRATRILPYGRRVPNQKGEGGEERQQFQVLTFAQLLRSNLQWTERKLTAHRLAERFAIGELISLHGRLLEAVKVSIIERWYSRAAHAFLVLCRNLTRKRGGTRLGISTTSEDFFGEFLFHSRILLKVSGCGYCVVRATRSLSS